MTLKIRNLESPLTSFDPQQGIRVGVDSLESSKKVNLAVAQVLKKRPRSLDDLDLSPEAKKIDRTTRLAYLDLARKVDFTQKDLGAEVALRRSIDIIGISGLQSSFSLDRSDLISSKTAQVTEQFFSKKRIESNTVYGFFTMTGAEMALLKQENGWKKYRVVSGSFNTALISPDGVLKIGKEEFIYERDQNRLDRIYARIGNSSRGIQKRIEDSGSRPELFRWSLEDNAKIPVKYHREYPYVSDMFDVLKRGTLAREERIKIYDSLVAGSKKLIQNGIYHLDTKLENVGYLGGGVVEHFDFGGAFILDEAKRKIMTRGVFPPSLILPKDKEIFEKLLESLDKAPAISFLEKIHVFQLGAFFYEVSTNAMPYTNFANGSMRALSPQEYLKRRLESQQDPDEPQNIDLILKMLSEKAEDRPNIAEVEAVIQGAALSKFSEEKSITEKPNDT